jgi:SAM-dependent methyltransferase
MRCPICGASDAATILERARLPVFQNVVYASAEEARAAPTAPFELSTCRGCGFSWNSRFDPALVIYDERYDNDVVSQVFDAFYRGVATMLIARFGLDGGGVLDVGCGSGRFLRQLCALAPTVRGIGIDPSCEELDDGNVKLVRGRFGPEHVARDVSLVTLRHVLEHIHDPVSFAAMIARSLPPSTPLYVEVPDLDWIYRHAAFWDFSYEHVNYFTAGSLQTTLEMAGLTVVDHASAFGGQYHWAICISGRPSVIATGSPTAVTDGTAHARRETSMIAEVEALARRHGGAALWGMSTKGVVLSNLLAPELITGGVDMNSAKQGRFAAGSGLAIHAAEWLREPAAGAAVIVVNPNYTDEIRLTMADLGVSQHVLTL